MIHPVPIAYGEAITIAVVGLAVNLLSAWLLRDDTHDHEHHGHGHSHEHHHHRDNNLRAAYVHVLADAATSVLAILALLVAMSSQWVWIDPLVGIVGSAVIASWAFGLIRQSAAVLLDVASDKAVESAIRERLEIHGDRITDLHLWQIGPGHHAAVVSHPVRPAAGPGGLQGPPGRCAEPEPRHGRGPTLSRPELRKIAREPKKGRRQADGPSLGRKRPRRAAEDRAEARYRAAAICSRDAQNASPADPSPRMAVNNRTQGSGAA